MSYFCKSGKRQFFSVHDFSNPWSGTSIVKLRNVEIEVRSCLTTDLLTE